MSFLQAQIAQLIQLAKKKSEEEPYNEITQWVATDATQYIDTGFIADQNSKIEIGFNIFDTGTAVKAVFGSRKWNGSVISQAFYLYKTNSAIVQVGWGNQSKNITLDSATELQAPIKLIIDKGDVTLVTNAKTYIETFTSTTFETPTSLVIGTCRTGTSGTELDNRPANVDVRYCKLWDNGTLTYNYYPALDDKTQPCLYDKVTKTFTYAKKISDGTTAYDLTYKRWNKFDVDYIESTGTQYIDTGYAFTEDYSWEIDFSDLTGTSCTLFGGRTSSTRTALLYKNLNTVLSGEITCPIAGYNGSQTLFTTGLYSDSGRHKVKMHVANNKGSLWVDDVIRHDNVSFTGTYISGTTQALFGDNFGGTTGVTELASAKLYHLTMWQGTQVVRDYKPVVWHNGNTTAVACLYDKVYNKMYTNANTATGATPFKAYIVGSDNTVYEVGSSIQSSGTQWIDTNIYPTVDTGIHIRYAYPTISNSEYAGVCGIYQGTAPRTDTLFITTNDAKTNTNIYMFQRGVQIATNVTPVANTFYEGRINYYNCGMLEFGDHINFAACGTNNIEDGRPIPLFSRYKPTGDLVICKALIAYVEFTVANTLIKEYIPVKLNNTVGFYDRINDDFILSESGTFTFNALS